MKFMCDEMKKGLADGIEYVRGEVWNPNYVSIRCRADGRGNRVTYTSRPYNHNTDYLMMADYDADDWKALDKVYSIDLFEALCSVGCGKTVEQKDTGITLKIENDCYVVTNMKLHTCLSTNRLESIVCLLPTDVKEARQLKWRVIE